MIFEGRPDRASFFLLQRHSESMIPKFFTEKGPPTGFLWQNGFIIRVPEFDFGLMSIVVNAFLTILFLYIIIRLDSGVTADAEAVAFK